MAVEDTGPGIGPEHLTRIFDAFDQADSTARVGGTGLGLTISRDFARLMQGDLVVETTPGTGSVFTFSFEAAAAAAESVPGRVAHQVPTGLASGQPAVKVLIVDDVATNRDLLDELLSPLGFVTRTAASAEDAIEIHDEWQPQLVLMDLRMPGMGGLEGTRRLRQGGSTAAIVAVTASGMTDADARGARRRRGRLRAEAVPRSGAARGHRRAAGRPLRLRIVGRRAGGPGVVRDAEWRSALSQRFGSLPPDLIDQLREAAIEGRARRLEALADQVRLHSEDLSAEVRALARDFDYDALVSALVSRSHDDA